MFKFRSATVVLNIQLAVRPGRRPRGAPMTLLRVDASIQGPRSQSSALADLVVGEYAAARPGEPVVTRHLGQHPLPSDAWALALGASATPQDERTPAQVAALRLAHTVAAELREADHAVLALP